MSVDHADRPSVAGGRGGAEAGRPSPPDWLWLVPAALGGALTAVVMLVLPPDRTLDDVGEVLFKLAPLCLAVLAVALFPRGRWGPALVVGGVVVYMGLVDTAYVLRVLDYVDAAASGEDGGFAPFYQFTLFVNAFTVLLALFAFRLGGAGRATVLRVGFAAVLVVVSGLNDLTYWALADWPDGRPGTLDWASHVAVFVGRPSVTRVVVFTLVHLALAAAVLVVRRRARGPAAAEPAGRGDEFPGAGPS